MPENHRLYRGVFGFAGHFSARSAMLQDNAQRILAIGTALDEVTTGGWDQSTGLDRQRLVHISNNPDHESFNQCAALHSGFTPVAAEKAEPAPQCTATQTLGPVRTVEQWFTHQLLAGCRRYLH
ncbi:MAG: hypothetical protein R3F38_09995 [Gammaproteobacteria bacterium]